MTNSSETAEQAAALGTASADEAQYSATPAILFILYPERSAFNASFTLARRLKERGYRILYGGLEEFRDHVIAQGFHYELLEPLSPENPADPPPRGIRRWLHYRRLIRQGREVSEELMARCEDYLKATRPTLVLLDPIIWSYALPPLRCGVPIISFSTSLASAFNTTVPPVFCDLPPSHSKGWKAALRHGIAWSKFIVPMWWQLHFLEPLHSLRMFLPPRSMIARIRRNGGRIRWSEYGPRLDVPELVVSPREFDFPQAALGSRRIYVGSCVEVSRSDGAFDWSWREADKPLLYCSLGTYSHVYPHARRLFEAVIAALQRREDMQAIVQVGSCAETDAFGALPARIRVVKHAPQIEVLARANVFITHGGLGSVREAIYCGVPMLVFPCWNDQPGNAARIVHHGLGLGGDIATVDMSAILRLLGKIADPGFMNNIRAMQAVFRAQENCQAGVDYIEERLRAA
ncbi:MAG: glycosyltransferase [Zoogloeaceae bacterium]|jgi:UDP:flavonoid glycosyltransferase YjiC (YdhE family)|nr:glycosyltransferase [Zoogloeaceae bacterium]